MKTGHMVAIASGILLIGVGAADMAFGNTNQPVLPTFITNNLTQQIDIVLVLGGGALLFFAMR